jgi:hypothetical protein
MKSLEVLIIMAEFLPESAGYFPANPLFGAGSKKLRPKIKTHQLGKVHFDQFDYSFA